MSLNKKLSQQVHEEAENDELWAISYGDMITLLLSFFVIFFSTDFKKNQEEKLDNHLISNFKMMDLKVTNKNPPTSENAGSGKKFDDVPKFEMLKNVKITKLDDRLLVTFDKMNFFDTAEVNPNKEGSEMLKVFAEKILPYVSLYKISIKAFTDKRPVKNNHRYKDNMELSALRALSALRVLQNAGVPLNKLEIAGYGEMNKLHNFITPEKIKALSGKELLDISRTIVIIIKHDNEQSVL
jgi:chemotaxis protein MotB